jgi:serine/threonine protein kinase
VSDPKEPDLQRTAFDPELGKRIRAAESGKLPALLTPAPMGTARTEIGPTSEPPVGDAITLTTGGRVKQFELIRELGRGGMGQVFLARDVRLGRLVALKFLGVRSPELVERFLVEARATARLQHENIVVL